MKPDFLMLTWLAYRKKVCGTVDNYLVGYSLKPVIEYCSQIFFPAANENLIWASAFFVNEVNDDYSKQPSFEYYYHDVQLRFRLIRVSEIRSLGVSV